MTAASPQAVPGQRDISAGSRNPAEPGLGTWAAFAAFLTPTFVWVEFTLVGRIFLPELILFALLPALLIRRGGMLTDPLPRTVLLLAVLWLLAQILTDVIRASDFRDYGRGWARIALTALNFCSLYLLLHRSRRRIVLFALGMAVGGYLAFLLNPSPYFENFPWKFSLGPSTALAAVVAAVWLPGLGAFAALPILAVGIYSMSVGARALAGVAIMTGLYMILNRIMGRRRGRTAGFSLGRSSLVLAGAIAAAALVIEFYAYMAAQGWLDERSRNVYEFHSQGPLGFLLGGRPEFLASTRAVLDSPLIGHGSWAKNPDYVAYLLDLGGFSYRLPELHQIEQDLIPTHSHLMGSWVEAGILGTVLWLWVLLLVFRVLMVQYMLSDPIVPLVGFAAFLMVWDIFFSPFGAERRYTVPFNIVLLIYAWDILRAHAARSVRARTRATPLHRTLRRPDRPAFPGAARRPVPREPEKIASRPNDAELEPPSS